MEDAEFPRVGRFTLDKFLDQFDETDSDLRVLFVNYDTNVPLDFKNLEREINQNAGRNFKQKEVLKTTSISISTNPWKSITSMLKFWHCIHLYMLFGQDRL